jgi:hypothetical protein
MSLNCCRHTILMMMMIMITIIQFNSVIVNYFALRFENDAFRFLVHPKADSMIFMPYFEAFVSCVMYFFNASLYKLFYFLYFLYFFYIFRFEDVCHGGGSLGLSEYRTNTNQCCVCAQPAIC